MKKHQLLSEAIENCKRYKSNKDWHNSASGKECMNVVFMLREATEFQVDGSLLAKEHFDFGADLQDKGLIKYPFSNTLFIVNRKDKPSIPVLVWHDASKTPIMSFLFHREAKGLLGLPLFSATLSNRGKYLLIKYPDVPMSERFISEAPQIIAELANDIFGICALLMSRNVYVHVEGAPERLNKKRLRQGKIAIAETRHIRVRTDERLISREHQGGTHASPVMHWRRGHMRRLESGKIVPVAPTIVNASDEHKPLAKEYIVT